MTAAASPSIPAITIPPVYCEYASGPCDQTFAETKASSGLFLYPTVPLMIANTIESAISDLKIRAGSETWLSWRDLGVSGQIVFCQICKAIRFTKTVVADVTTLNFNLLFEIGYSAGLGVPVIPIRDTSFSKDQRTFDALGLLDTLGYLDYQNSSELAHKLLESRTPTPMVAQVPGANTEQPLYVVKTHVQTDGLVHLMSALKKSGLRFRAFDPREVPRLSLHEATKQVLSSLGVIVPLLSEHRNEAVIHNARCAFVAGLAMASGKHVLMLQEGEQRQPIDYRDVVRTYELPTKVPTLVIPLIRSVVEKFQQSKFVPTALPLKLLEKVDIGDLAAENEIGGLAHYFVPTGQFNEAKRGHARLIVGRKGTGKTAIFYSIRSTYKPSKDHLVLDLKPDGHQFVKLREAVLSDLPAGVQQHVLTAFWNYLLLMEIARKIIFDESKYSYTRPEIRTAFLEVKSAYGDDVGTEQGDFSERLLALVDEIAERRGEMPGIATTPDVTALVYRQDIRKLSDALSEYLSITRKRRHLAPNGQYR